MKKLLYSFLFILPFFISQCSQYEDNILSTSENTNSVKIAITTKDGFDKIAGSAVAFVTADDMDTIITKLSIKPNTITGQINNIPVGKNRHFQVYVYDFDGKPIYGGGNYADVTIEQITYVSITLTKINGGTAIINGTIVEDETACKSIIITNLNVANTYYDPKIPSLSVDLSAWAKTDNGDPVQYQWAIYFDGKNQQWIDWKEKANVVSVDFPINGDVTVILLARCAMHNTMMASDTLFLQVKDGAIFNGSGIDTNNTNECKTFPLNDMNVTGATVDFEKKEVGFSICLLNLPTELRNYEYSLEIHLSGSYPYQTGWSTIPFHLFHFPLNSEIDVIGYVRCPNDTSNVNAGKMHITIKDGKVSTQ